MMVNVFAGVPIFVDDLLLGNEFHPTRGYYPIHINDMFGDDDLSPASFVSGFVCNTETFKKLHKVLEQRNLWHELWLQYKKKRTDQGRRLLSLWMEREVDLFSRK